MSHSAASLCGEHLEQPTRCTAQIRVTTMNDHHQHARVQGGNWQDTHRPQLKLLREAALWEESDPKVGFD
jgi:hypothetical protein